jgi:hypothetical protein
MSKLGLHFQNTTNWMRRIHFSAPYVKLMDPPEDDILPDKHTIGRVFMKDGEEGSYYMRGAEGGADYFRQVLGWYLDSPYVWAWEAWNEPAMIHTPQERAALCEATVEWARLMHGRGYRVVVGNFSERNPADGTIVEFAPMLDVADYLGVHMYGAPHMQTDAPGHALRYRQLAEEIDRAGLRLPKMLIGECGIDLGIIGKGRKGWQKSPGLDWGKYRDELVWYDGQLGADDYVAGGFVFSAATTREWQTFNITEKQARDLARALA